MVKRLIQHIEQLKMHLILKYGFHTECVPVSRKYNSLYCGFLLHALSSLNWWLVIPFSVPCICHSRIYTIVQKTKTIIHDGYNSLPFMQLLQVS